MLRTMHVEFVWLYICSSISIFTDHLVHWVSYMKALILKILKRERKEPQNIAPELSHSMTVWVIYGG